MERIEEKRLQQHTGQTTSQGQKNFVALSSHAHASYLVPAYCPLAEIIV